MPYIDTVAEDDATGLVAESYEESRRAFGYVTNYTKAFSARPEVLRVPDAVGAEPDPAYRDLDPRLREILTVGRPLA